MRMRAILPKLWESETFAGVSWDARFMLMGLWSYCDDEGRGLDKTALIAATLFPFDLQSDPTETYRRTTAALDELAAAKLICRYQSRDDDYLQVLDWGDWQRPVRPTPSRIPSYRVCVECGASICVTGASARVTGVTRTDANYCSSACRQRAYRNRSRNAQNEPVDPDASESVTGDADESASQSGGYGKFMSTHEDSRNVYLESRESRVESRESKVESERARGTRLPASWQPTPDVVAQMRSDHPHVNQHAELDKFCDYWQSKAGKDAQKMNWDATYRNWIRRAAEQQQSRNGHGPSTADQRVAQAQALKKQFRNPPELT